MLDPLPAWLLKVVNDNLVPFLTQLINTFIASGVVPCCLKHANVTPLLKKANIDQDNTNSYRSIYNLPFMSKLLERDIARCLLDYMSANNPLERYQSPYKFHHSTETALVLVQNDILRSVVILVPFDISAAFDTVNHEILLSSLEYRFGMIGSMVAYLTDRSQCVYYKVVIPAEPASLVAYLKDRCWDLCCSLRTQLLSVIYSGATISDSI